MLIEDIRKQYPQYAEVSDGDLALALHRKHYPDMHIKDFMAKVDPEDRARFTISDDMWAYWVNQVERPMEGEDAATTSQRVAGEIKNDEVKIAEGMTRAAGQGITFGGMDELVGAVSAAAHPLVQGRDGTTFEERRQAYTDRERGQIEQFRESHPKTALASEVAGGLATIPAAPALAPFKGAPVANAALTGGAYGSAYGFGTGEGSIAERAPDALRGGVIGGATGGTLALVGKGLGWLFRPSTKAPSLEKLRAASRELVQRAEANGLVVNPGKYKRFIAEAVDELQLDPVNHSGTASVLKSLVAEADNPLTPKLIQQLRQRINDGVTSQAGVVDKNGQKAIVLLNKFDDMVEGLVADDVATAGTDPKQVTTWLKQHRALWRRYRKGQTLAKAEDLASLRADSNQATDYAQALRTEYRNLSRRIIKGTERGFTQQEADAIRKAATGTKLNRSLKLLSKFRFDPSGNLVGSGMGAGAGYMVGGYPGMVAVPAIGSGASVLNNALMKGHLNRASEVVRGLDDPVIRQLGLLQQSAPRGSAVAGPVSQAIQNQVAPAAGRVVHPLFARGQTQQPQPMPMR